MNYHKPTFHGTYRIPSSQNSLYGLECCAPQWPPATMAGQGVQQQYWPLHQMCVCVRERKRGDGFLKLRSEFNDEIMGMKKKGWN